MIKPNFFPTLPKTNYEFQIGESLENKIKRITENNEPITDGAPIIYTNRADGVLPAYNIRTDRWEIAQAAMDAVNQANLAKSKNYGKIDKEDKEALDSQDMSNSQSGQQESAG
nr:MAG TPA: hypothetical protein [Microviridae sp.]